MGSMPRSGDGRDAERTPTTTSEDDDVAVSGDADDNRCRGLMRLSQRLVGCDVGDGFGRTTSRSPRGRQTNAVGQGAQEAEDEPTLRSTMTRGQRREF